MEPFKKQFSDFENMETIFQLFADPMAVTIEDQDPELQMELCKLQQRYSTFFKTKYDILTIMEHLTCMFGRTYTCECAFSTMKMLMSKRKNRLSEEALKSILHIVTTEMEADIVVLVNKHPAQCAH
ncbi:hypothetical protein PR048_002043 [Dryococelus australis]|uniref:Uncharacterized protein n=1 Tax=Dryococelus australis TaxID=614101 RepID=A0ABQ9IJ24_9NEOP|nr:hypothetical protein PR048_002043 [Dryococelus australis]